MKKTIKFLTIIMLTGISLYANAQQTNFSGSWKRNDEKTNPGDLSINSVPVLIEVQQDGKMINLKSTSKNRAGEAHITTQALKVDETDSDLDKKHKNSIKWSDNTQQFIETRLNSDEQGNVVQRWKLNWSLENGGTALRIVVDVEVNGSEHHMEEVYDKQ